MNTVQFWLDNWTTILSWVGAAGGVSIALQLLKKKLHIDGAKMVHVLLVIFSALPVITDYILNYGQQNPDALPKNFSFVFTLAVLVHRFAVSPVSKKIETFLNTTYADAQKYEELQQAQMRAAKPRSVQPTTSGSTAATSYDPTILG